MQAMLDLVHGQSHQGEKNWQISHGEVENIPTQLGIIDIAVRYKGYPARGLIDWPAAVPQAITVCYRHLLWAYA